MTDPRIIIAVLCAAAITIAALLFVVVIYSRMLFRRDRLIAALTNEAEEYDLLVAKLTAERDGWKATATAQAKSLSRMSSDNAYLRARLAPFIAKRERDAKGHFLPTVRSEAA